MSKISDMQEQIKQQQYLLVKTKLEEAIKAITEGKKLSKEEEQDYQFSAEDVNILRGLLKENKLSYQYVYDYDFPEGGLLIIKVNNQYIKIDDGSYRHIPDILSLDEAKEIVYSFFVGDAEGMSEEEIKEDLEFREIDIEEKLGAITDLQNIDLDSIAITSSNSKQQTFGDETMNVDTKLQQSIQDIVDGRNQTITYEDNDIDNDYDYGVNLQPDNEDVIYNILRNRIPDYKANAMFGENINFCEIGEYEDMPGEESIASILNSMSRETLKKYFEQYPEDIALFEQMRGKYADIQGVEEEMQQSNDSKQPYTGYSFEEFIKETKQLFKRPIMVMGDSSSMSVQASAFHYCEPRRSGLDSYKSYEVSYPSQVIEQLKDYLEMPVESDEELLESLYANVPAEVLSQIVMEHGGVDKEATLYPEKKLDGYKQEKAGMDDKTRKAQELLNQMVAQLGNVLEDDEIDNK